MNQKTTPAESVEGNAKALAEIQSHLESQSTMISQAMATLGHSIETSFKNLAAEMKGQTGAPAPTATPATAGPTEDPSWFDKSTGWVKSTLQKGYAEHPYLTAAALVGIGAAGGYFFRGSPSSVTVVTAGTPRYAE